MKSAFRCFLFTPTNGLNWAGVFSLYVISHGFLLASWNTIYWDDWNVYARGSLAVREFFEECSRCTVPLRGELESILVGPGFWLIRLITFLIFPLIAILFYSCLKRLDWFSAWEISVYTLFVLFLPMYGARIALIDFQYSLSLFLFVLGAWMLLSRNFICRVFSTVPIFWSLFVPSLRFFILCLIVVVLVRTFQQRIVFSLEIGTQLVVFSSLPIVHQFVVPRVIESLRVTDGYNSIRPLFLARAILVLVVSLLPLFYIFVRDTFIGPAPKKREVVELASGLALIGIGTFPYLAVGHFAELSDWVLPFLPNESDWNSRHQLLQPFGFALALVAVSHILGSRKKQFVRFVLGVSVLLNLATYSGYYLDGLKQNEVISAIANSAADFEGVEAIVVDDQSPRFNARGRHIRSYEWSAMIYRALNKEVSADSDRIMFCQVEHPTKKITIVAKYGRLRSLFQNSVGVEVVIEDLEFCADQDT